MVSTFPFVKYLVRSLASIVGFVNTAIKLRDLMPRREALRLARALCSREPENLPVCQTDFLLRKGSTDLYTFKDVFLNDSVKIPAASDLRPNSIVDLGGHIGCTSLYFALKYPESKIISVEPDAENFALMSKNLLGYSNVYPINAAVWDHLATVEIANPNSNPTGRFVAEKHSKDEGGVEGLTVPDIMRIGCLNHIDILKLDVEGAELRLFETPRCHDWLPKVSVLIVELHDRKVPGCSRALFRALERYNYELIESHGHVLIVKMAQTSVS